MGIIEIIYRSANKWALKTYIKNQVTNKLLAYKLSIYLSGTKSDCIKMFRYEKHSVFKGWFYILPTLKVSIFF